MIQAFARLHRSAPDVRRPSYGDGSRHVLLVRPVRRLRIQLSTTFLGWVPGDRLPELRGSVDLFASVSRPDSWIGAAAEAMTSPGPVPSPATVAARERISGAQNGSLAETGDLDVSVRGVQVLPGDPILRETLFESLVTGATPYELLRRGRHRRSALDRVGTLNPDTAPGAVGTPSARAHVHPDTAMTSWNKFCRDMCDDREPWESK